MELIEPNGEKKTLGSWPEMFVSNGETYNFARISVEDGESFGAYIRQSDKAELLYRLPDAIALAEKTASEDKPQPALQAAFDKEGWMTIKVNMVACASSEDMFCTMRGFLDSKRDQCMALVNQMRVQAAQAKEKILKVKNQGMFARFLNGKRS